jgi:hypothetical protein
MSVGHDGSVFGGLTGKYHGLGRSEEADPYESYRKGGSRR